MNGTKYYGFIFLLLAVNLSLADSAESMPDFKKIYIRVANQSDSSSIDELVSKLDAPTLFDDFEFKKSMTDIGVQNLPILLVSSTVILKDGVRTAFNMTQMLQGIAKTAPSTTDTATILQIVKDSFELDKRGENIDYSVIGNNVLVVNAFSNGGIPYQIVSQLIDVGNVMTAFDVKEVLLATVSTNETSTNILLQNVDYNILVSQIKIENLAKNQMIAGLLQGYGIDQDMLNIIANLDSSLVTKAFDFNKIVDNIMKIRAGDQKSDADWTRYIKIILSSIKPGKVAELLNLNKFINTLLKQKPVVDYLKGLGLSADLIKSILNDIKINDFLKDMDFNKLLQYNGTSLFGFYQFIVDKIDLNKVLTDFDIEALLSIPQIEALLNQTQVDTELIRIVLESVNVNDFLKSFNVPGLIRDVRSNTDQDYIKILFNNTDIDGLIKSINVDKLFSHQQVSWENVNFFIFLIITNETL